MTPEPVTMPPSIALLGTPIIITSVVVSFFIAVIILFFCCYFGRQFAKKKQAEIASSRMSRALNFNLATYKQAESPQPRVDSVSDYYSDISRNTNTTQIGSHISHGSMYKQRQSMAMDPSNPPPSPMTLAHSHNALTDIEDDISVFSQTMSEYPIPPVPNPSLNYDLVSDNLSYSVSQSHFQATISGRAPNPLLLGQQPNHPYYNGGYHYPQQQQQVANQWAPKRGQDDQPDQGKQYSSSDYHHYPPSHPRKELDSLARTETESTISMTTVSTENQDEYLYDNEEGMSYAPPGRPPSPVTVVSDYHPPAPPMSPDSTLSEISDEDCSERHLHQT